MSNPTFGHAAALFKVSGGHYHFKDSNGGYFVFDYFWYISFCTLPVIYSEKIIKWPVASIPPELGWWIEFKDVTFNAEIVTEDLTNLDVIEDELD